MIGSLQNMWTKPLDSYGIVFLKHQISSYKGSQLMDTSLRFQKHFHLFSKDERKSHGLWECSMRVRTWIASYFKQVLYKISDGWSRSDSSFGPAPHLLFTGKPYSTLSKVQLKPSVEFPILCGSGDESSLTQRQLNILIGSQVDFITLEIYKPV